MSPTVETHLITAPRVTYRSTVPFELAESRLRSSIQRQQTPTTTFQTSKPAALPTKEAFVSDIESRVGPHGFMHFTEFNHGAWLTRYYPEISSVATKDGETKNLRSIRFILGNPLIAKTMLRHDLNAGLSVPVELLLAEEADGSAQIVHFKPNGLIAGYEGAKKELVSAADILEEKIETLIRWTLRDGEPGEVKGSL